MLEWTVTYHGVISALAALMSSAAAIVLLVLAILQHRWNKQHNKALVKPFLTGVLLGEPTSEIAFYVVNKGLGTALIDELKIIYHGNSVSVREFSKLLMRDMPSFEVAVGEFNNQYALSPNDQFQLARIKLKSTAVKNMAQMRGELEIVSKALTIQVDYHSLLDSQVKSYISRNDLSLLNA